ncbi:Protein SCO1, mitochondrial [Leucoagaricus sp. SymC.cos]|nr:Protein SCO1, mitochondrial [Leucoagaricus sp. SymC.cos]
MVISSFIFPNPPNQVFTPVSAALFVATGISLFFYFRHEKQKLLEERERERKSRQYGRPQVGGPFSLTTSTRESFTEKNMLGKWSLVYFGFTNCPDICPAELDKVGSVLNKVGTYTTETELGKIFLPIFISVDPARDTPERIGRYLDDFHPSFVGLVGPYDVTKAACRAYRVYFSTPPNADPNGDYLVDHSIFVYLMDPDGRFVEAFGQSVEADQIVEKIREEVAEWESATGGKVAPRG